MTARVHRTLVAVLGSLTAITAILEKADPSALGISDLAWTWLWG